MLITMSAIIMVVYVIRTLILLIGIWIGLALIQKLHRQLSDKLFRAYLYQDYRWHIASPQERIFQNLTVNAIQVVQNAIVASIDILGGATLIIAFAATLAWLRPLETLVLAGIVGGLAALNFLVLRNRALRWGRRSNETFEALFVSRMRDSRA